MEQERRSALRLGVIALAMLVAMTLLNPQLLPDPVRRAVGLGEYRLGSEQPVGSATSYAFIATQSDGVTPVTYNPCRELRVLMNPDGAPRQGEELVRHAMARIEETTGLRLVYGGTTSRVARWDEDRTPVMASGLPVLVTWSTEDEVSQLAGDVAGIGGSVWSPEARTQRYFTGQVTLDREGFDDILDSPNGRAVAQAVVLHEFGHLVGLDHVDDRTQLMYKRTTRRTDFGRGDLAGLARLGRGRC